MQYTKSDPPKLSETRNEQPGVKRETARRGSVCNAARAAGEPDFDKTNVTLESVTQKVSETIHLKKEIDRRRELLQQPLLDIKNLAKNYETNIHMLNQYMTATGRSHLSSPDGEIVLENKSACQKLDKASRMSKLFQIAQHHQVSDAGNMVKKIMDIKSEKKIKSVVHVKPSTMHP